MTIELKEKKNNNDSYFYERSGYRHGHERSGQDGLSLLELILAIAVFVIGTATVAHLFIGSQTSMNYSLEKSQAMLLARQGIEEERAKRNEDFGNLVQGTYTETISLDDKEFERIVKISFLSDTEAEVVSTVEWTSLGREEDISFVEIITDWQEEEEEEEEEEEKNNNGEE